MSATTTQQYRRIRQQRVVDAAGAASGIVTEWMRYINNAHAYRLRPIVCPGFGWLNYPAAGTEPGFSISTASTAEVYLFAMGKLWCPPGYSTIRYAICCERTAGASAGTLTLRLASELYRGPRSGTFTTGYISAGSKALNHSIGAGINIFTGTAGTGINYSGAISSRPYLGTQTGLASVYPFLTLTPSSGAAHTWKIYVVSMALEDGTGSSVWSAFDDLPQNGTDLLLSANKQPAAASVLLSIVERLNFLAANNVRCLWNMSHYNTGALPATLTPVMQTQYWDGRKNFPQVMAHYTTFPDNKAGAAADVRKIRCNVEANVDVTVDAWAAGGDSLRPYSLIEANSGETLTAAPSDAINPIIVSEQNLAIDASSCVEVPLANPGSSHVWIDPSRFSSRRGIYDADWEELRSIVDQCLYEYRQTIVACSVRDPTDITTPRTFRISATHTTQYRSLLTGVYPETYSATKPGWPTWSLYCARGITTTATVHCYVWARVLSDTEAATLRVETEVSSATLALAANTPTLSWRGPVAVTARATTAGTYPQYGDWLQGFCKADATLEAGEFIDIGAFCAILTGVT